MDDGNGFAIECARRSETGRNDTEKEFGTATKLIPESATAAEQLDDASTNLTGYETADLRSARGSYVPLDIGRHKGVVRMPVWPEVQNSTSQYSSTPNLEPIPGIICFGIERDANGYGIP